MLLLLPLLLLLRFFGFNKLIKWRRTPKQIGVIKAWAWNGSFSPHRPQCVLQVEAMLLIASVSVSKLPLLNDTRHVPEQNVCEARGGRKPARFKRAADAGNEISPQEAEEELVACRRSLQRIVMQARSRSLLATQCSPVKVNWIEHCSLASCGQEQPLADGFTASTAAAAAAAGLIRWSVHLA